jgi:6-phosphogluconate dehydrogenase
MPFPARRGMELSSRSITGRGMFFDPVAAFDAGESRKRELVDKFRGQPVTLFECLEQLVGSLDKPWKIMMLVPAGAAV